jgi:Aldo/keto reductase family
LIASASSLHFWGSSENPRNTRIRTVQPRKLWSHKKGKRHEIRNARQYGSSGFKALLRNHDIRGWQRALQGPQFRGPAEADELVKTSIDAGINFFDTADNYTEGESEKILGQSLKNLNIARKDVVIATKVYSRVGSGQNDVGASRGHIMDAVEASLRRCRPTISTCTKSMATIP